MKKLKTSFLAIALLAGISAAFVQKVSASANGKFTTYNWTHFDQSGNPIGTLDNATVQQARDQLGCPGSVSVKCATAPGAPTIYYH